MSEPSGPVDLKKLREGTFIALSGAGCFLLVVRVVVALMLVQAAFSSTHQLSPFVLLVAALLTLSVRISGEVK